MTQHPHAELSAYIDGALAPAAQAAVEGHLVTCDLCRAHVAQLRATVSLMRALPDPVPSRRLVPRLARAPAWLAPLRTLMTLASGAAVFLFIASAVLTNITFLAGGSGTTTLSAPEFARDTSVNAPGTAQPASTSNGGPAPAGSPNAAFAVTPTASPIPDAARVAAGAASPIPTGATPDDAQKRIDRATAAPSDSAPAAAAGPQERGQLNSSAPQRPPLLNPWLWLALALISGAIAIALHRRLRASV
jgi:putative zinc finger protein